MNVTIKTCLILALCVLSLRGSARVQSQTLPDAPKPAERGDRHMRFFQKTAEAYLAGGTWLDLQTTAQGLNHPTMAWGKGNTFLGSYPIVEGDWARVFTRRNAFVVNTANLALNVGVLELSRGLYRKGGRWRYAAVALVAAKATGNVVDGIRNVRIRTGIDGYVRHCTGYRGEIRWTP